MSDVSPSLHASASHYRKGGLVEFEGFRVPKESLSKSDRQLQAVAALSQVDRQFIGTMVDTEVASGYFFRKSNVTGGIWVAYVAVKMKYGGDLRHFADLVAHIPPGRHWYANTIKGSPDLRWSLQVQGIVAYALLKVVRPHLYNEKAIVEVDCILAHGPIVPASTPHPFATCGAKHLRRGVWFWPQIDEDGTNKTSTAPK